MQLSLQAAVPADWTASQRPFRIADNLYYVGSRDLAAYLVPTPQGNILINANLASSPSQIRASVRELGFHWRDTKILLLSQPHYDHAAGAAEIVRETGARLMVMDGDAQVVESGDAHDFGGSDLLPYAPVHVDHVLHDGEVVRLGGVALTAHRTAGHSRGCTTWTMTTTQGGREEPVVIVGGYAALNSYRLVATPGHPTSYPGIAADFEQTFQTLQSLPCGIFLGAHGSYFGMQAKLKQMPVKGERVWIDPAGYRTMIARAQRSLEQRIEEQTSYK
jgi:metallo-beta-lactamase class B